MFPQLSLLLLLKTNIFIQLKILDQVSEASNWYFNQLLTNLNQLLEAFTEAVSNKLALRVIDDLINELQLLKSVYSSFVGNYEVTQINYASIENR